MPLASFNLYASAVRQLLGSTIAFLGCARVRSAHPRWTCRVWGSLRRRDLIRDPVAGGGCLLGSNWSLLIKLSEVLGGSSALTCLIFFPNMEALVSMTNTTFLGTAGRSLGAK